MKHLFAWFAFVLILSSCKKEDLPRVPEPPDFGTITFDEYTPNNSTAAIGQIEKEKKLHVYSVISAPNGSAMQTRIFAWNGLHETHFRAMEIYINGGFDDFPLNNPNVVIHYYKNQLPNTTVFVPYNPEYLTIRSIDYVPAFQFPQRQYGSVITKIVPINFSQFVTQTASENRKIRASIPDMIFGADTLKNLQIDIKSFGGNLMHHNKCMTFDVNGKPAGSFENQALSANGISQKPGILKMTASFEPDSRNPITSLTLEFVHHSSRLAYNGPVGKFDLSDGTGYTEIKITAIDQNGITFREQKGKGFVRTFYENPWVFQVSFPSNTIYPGQILLEFGAELISDSGQILNITNGQAYFNILE